MTEVKEAKLSDAEMKIWHRTWDVLSHEWTLQGRLKTWSDSPPVNQKAWGLMAVKSYKYDEQNNLEFQGLNPTNGFGVRRIMPQDVFGATNLVWDVTWTAGRRNWLNGTNVPNNTTFEAAPRIRLTDTAQINWSVAIWGVRSLHPSPKAHSILIDLEDKGQAEQYVGDDLKRSELRKADFDRVYAVPRKKSFKMGVLVATGVVGADTLIPEGLSILDSQRAKQVTVTFGTAV